MTTTIEPTLQSEFDHLLDQIKSCYQCGTCTGGCPVFRVYPDFNPRIIVETILTGQTGQLLIDDLIWYCSLCYTCTTRCPQGIDVGHLLIELKNLARQLKNVPEGIINEFEAIRETGITSAISESILKKREKLGLPQLPLTDTKEIQKLLDIMGVSEELIREVKRQKDDSLEEVTE
ncbi:MAG: 4Fe-4S dicluster domain-containing protein [Candidatus Thorarchaeota archaeon]